MSIYFDYNATTPVEEEVAKLVFKLMTEEYGNAGSVTHHWGRTAQSHVEQARQQIATSLNVLKNDVVFTSGATESNNIAILGLKGYAEKVGKKHIITSAVEHKSVLEPLKYLSENYQFEVTTLSPDRYGNISSDDLSEHLREDTLLVSLMHINNETGCKLPIHEFSNILDSSEAYFHVDASQSFGKYTSELHDPRIDMLSVSGHKIFAPKGVGALILKRRFYDLPPLESILKGGGQEMGLRPGTLPVPIIAGFGMAIEIAERESVKRKQHATQIFNMFSATLAELGATINGANASEYCINFRLKDVSSEHLLNHLRLSASISTGSACTSESSSSSHVLSAMGLSENESKNSVRISWSHLTDISDVHEVLQNLKQLN